MTLGLALGMLLRPIVAFLVMLGVVAFARWLMSFVPEGRIKRLLTRRIGP